MVTPVLPFPGATGCSRGTMAACVRSDPEWYLQS